MRIFHIACSITKHIFTIQPGRLVRPRQDDTLVPGRPIRRRLRRCLATLFLLVSPPPGPPALGTPSSVAALGLLRCAAGARAAGPHAWHPLRRRKLRSPALGTPSVAVQGLLHCAARARVLLGPAEQTHGANAGLDIAVSLLKPIKEQFPILSYADFYQVSCLPEMCFQSRIPSVPHRMTFSCLTALQLAGVCGR